MSAAQKITLVAGVLAFILSLVALFLLRARTETWNVPMIVLAVVALIAIGTALRASG